jgi:phosphoglycerol geranylgeranyltransferase
LRNNIYNSIIQQISQGKKLFSLLIDPGKMSMKCLEERIGLANSLRIDLIFVGGSLLMQDSVRQTVVRIKELTDIPVLLYPGSTMQFCNEADGMLFLSLISGRNAEYLIGKHVEIAPLLKNSGIEIIPTGYMIIDTGKPTAVSYVSNSNPIPYDKFDIAACTAMAGEMLGMKFIYMDGGSGALKPINPEMIKAVKSNISVPLIIGGGINNEQQMKSALDAGADIVVVGNAIEENPELIERFASVAQSH